MVGHWELRGYGEYIYQDINSEKILGFGGLWYPEGAEAIKASWCTAVLHRRMGIAQEAMEAILKLYLSLCQHYPISAVIHRENLSSIALAERLGFKEQSISSMYGEDYLVWVFRPSIVE